MTGLLVVCFSCFFSFSDKVVNALDQRFFWLFIPFCRTFPNTALAFASSTSHGVLAKEGLIGNDMNEANTKVVKSIRMNKIPPQIRA